MHFPFFIPAQQLVPDTLQFLDSWSLQEQSPAYASLGANANDSPAPIENPMSAAKIDFRIVIAPPIREATRLAIAR